MAKRDAEKSEKGFLDTIKEDRYVLIVAVAILIFIASSSIALVSTAPLDVVAPVPSVYASVDNGVVSLMWNASATPGVGGYNIYRSAQQGTLGPRLNSLPVAALSYSDAVDSGTYYYTIRAVLNSSEDGNTRQLEVIVAKIMPSGLAIAINSGGEYATSRTVQLFLSAKDAKECRYKNDEDPEWGAWEAYKAAKIWTLSGGDDGVRMVAYQCRNSGESDIAIASVTLDQHAPLVSYVVTPLPGAVQINLMAKDAVSPYAQCTVNTDGTESTIKVPLSGGVGTYAYQQQLPSGSHSFSVKCTDQAGNPSSAVSTTAAVK